MMRTIAAGALILAALMGCTGSSRTSSTSSGGTPGPGGSGGSPSTGGGGAGGHASSSSGSGGTAGAGGAAACPTCGSPETIGTIGSSALNEVSGIVASLAHPGVFYVHNDSGDVPRFFAIDATGKLLATFSVSGANAIDWEDIARGPCPSGTCLYLADIGDNAEARGSYVIYRVPEPDPSADATLAAEALPFTYPDGSHNAETLLVDPTSGVITIVTKVFVGDSSIFELPMPLTPGTTAIAVSAGTVEPPSGVVLYTGGDVHPAGKGVLLRTYGGVWLYPKAPGASVASALAGKPCALPAPSEPQGEAIGWLADGSGFVSTSEGVSQPLHRVSCSAL